MKTWSRSDWLTLTGTAAAVVGIAVAVATPEFRRFVGFDCGGADLLGSIFHHSFCQHTEANLIGTWKYTVQDGTSGQQVTVLYHLYREKGCYEYFWEDGRHFSDDFHWNYDNNLISEHFDDNQHIAQTQITWIDDNHVEATIINDNVYPSMQKTKREYFRENG